MEFKDRKEGDILIVSIDGNIVLEETTELKEYVEIHIEDQSLEGIIINCEKVHYIDSSGLGLIVSIYKTLKTRNRKFALAALKDRTMEVFTLTKLDKILTIADNDESAMENLK